MNTWPSRGFSSKGVVTFTVPICDPAGHDPVDLDELVLDEGGRARARGRVAVDLRQVGAGRVLGDREQLRRVVRNLTENAERHATSTVRFGLRRQREWVELVVADDGPGIPPDQRERIFERFARLDASRDRPSGGTGLGLAIVVEVVAVHGGTVTVADSDSGARIVVQLPADDGRVGGDRAGSLDHRASESAGGI